MSLVDFTKGVFLDGYNNLQSAIPSQYSPIVSLLVFSILIAIYSIFTWKFYRYLSKKNLIELNLAKYNTSNHPIFSKLFGVILYFLQYIIILPFLIFFWFAVLALIILILSEELGINQVIIVSAAIVAAIRILAYYEEDLSKDLAKMFPFTVLAIFILSPGFFSLERVITNLAQVPALVTNIFYFLVFIIILEIILRILDLIATPFRSEEEEEE